MEANQQPDKHVPQPKRPYFPPALILFGDFASVTRDGGTIQSNDFTRSSKSGV